ncbi:MarR family winged helix-turn-helix transcriptional regulator [Actinoplanes aureus]|uniref:Winged helix-turn-helix transcriptional regulator n=1 Tax=Actinoplanes aureus TaxID=2792083 RepID=A0A931G1Y0_9ACTN|nr:MarR family winged helix-turn-helix transcriptional regulator [Actinoplanes aureus]MBG0567525.1 winged helix-turn-helix transcriptional regulator [Actinoplanes aureus]
MSTSDVPGTVDSGRADEPAAIRESAAPLKRVALLCRSSNLIRRHLERTVLRSARLTWSSYDILQLTVARRPIDTRTIAEIACVSKASVTICADDFVNRSLIRRGYDPQDRRRVLLHPTPAAWQLIQDIRARLAAEIDRLLHGGLPGLDADATTLLHQIVCSTRHPTDSPVAKSTGT